MVNCKDCGNKFERTIDPKSDFCSRCFLHINECPKKLRFKVEIDIDGDPNELYEYLVSFLNLTHYINSYDIQIYLPEDRQTPVSGTCRFWCSKCKFTGNIEDLANKDDCESFYCCPNCFSTSFLISIIKEQEISDSRKCDSFQTEQCIDKTCNGLNEECWLFTHPLGPLFEPKESSSEDIKKKREQLNKKISELQDKDWELALEFTVALEREKKEQYPRHYPGDGEINGERDKEWLEHERQKKEQEEDK